MPETEVVLFAENDRSSPLLQWLDELPEKAQDKCIVRIERLAAMGHELRRPDADFLRDGIYELRVRERGIQYRILYFFHGKQAVLSHGFIKKGGSIPAKEIERATERKSRFVKSSKQYTYQGELQ